MQEAEAIAGKMAMAGLLTVVNASEKDYEKLSGSIDNYSGTAKKMADMRLGTLGLKLAYMQTLKPLLGVTKALMGMKSVMDKAKLAKVRV